jgi:hypothetical protein
MLAEMDGRKVGGWAVMLVVEKAARSRMLATGT